ncbi:MAG: CPBP family intramembrane metalloprotease [Clostridiales bacterium]|nr:CPBP family intramembrane metalloprotease [Clostridiales bacterium]
MSDNRSEQKARGKVGDYIFPWVSSFTALSIFMGTQVVVVAFMALTKLNYSKYQGVYSTLYSLVSIGGLLFFAYFSKFFFSDRNSGIHFSRPDRMTVFITIIIALGLLGMVNVYMFVANTIADMMKEGVVAEEMEKYSESVDRYSDVEAEVVPMADKLLYYISTVLLVPLGEELLFRGLTLGAFLKRYPAWISVTISALIFGLCHGLSIHIGYAFLSGIVIGCVYCFTRNIFYTYIIHLIFNFFGGTLGMILTDGWFEVSENMRYRITGTPYLVEILMIVPSVILLIALGIRFRAEKKMGVPKADQEQLQEITEE